MTHTGEAGMSAPYASVWCVTLLGERPISNQETAVALCGSRQDVTRSFSAVPKA